MIPVVSQFLSPLIGVATLRQAHVINSKVSNANRRITNNRDTLRNLQSDFLSYIDLTRSNFDQTYEAIKLNHAPLVGFGNKMATLQEHERSTELMVSMLPGLLRNDIRNQMAENRLLALTEKWRRTISDLTRSHLSIDLIPEKHLQQQLDRVSTTLKQSYHGLWRPVKKSASDYYRRSDILYARKGRDIMVTVPVPLESTTSMFELFYVHVMEVPLNGTTRNCSRIEGTKPILAVSKDGGQYYLTMTAEQFASCTQSEGIYRCKSVLAAYNKDTVSDCTYQVYMNNPKGIKASCGMSYSPNSLKTRIFNLEGQDRMLIVTDDPFWHKQCPGRDLERITGCNFCLPILECQCTYFGPSGWKIPPRLQHCKSAKEAQAESTLHVVNSQYIWEFEQAHKITSDAMTATKHLSNINIVDLNLSGYNNSWSNLVKRHAGFQTNLKAVISNVKKGEQSFIDKSDALQAHVHAQAIQAKSTFSWLPYVSLTWNAMTTMCLVFFAIKMHAFGMALTVLQHTVHVKSEPLSIQQYFSKISLCTDAQCALIPCEAYPIPGASPNVQMKIRTPTQELTFAFDPTEIDFRARKVILETIHENVIYEWHMYTPEFYVTNCTQAKNHTSTESIMLYLACV